MTDAPLSATLESISDRALIGWVAEVSSYDRYQASKGICEAAALVGEHAAASGVATVVREHPVQQRRRWWSFESPRSWTPLVATVTVSDSRGELLMLRHSDEPYLVATNSAPVRREEFPVVQAADESMRGGLVLLDDAAPSDIAAVEHAGARGFLASAAGAVHRRRVELPPESRLFGFSLTRAEMSLLRRCAQLAARVHIAVEESAAMPVVEALVPGRLEGEVWLTAHLCHPRPGANDNASGVAALLAALRAIAGSVRSLRGAHRSIRFVWGPEFVGAAAALHGHLQSGGATPTAVVNLDVVGTDQSRWPRPLLVERPRDRWLSALGPIADSVVGEVMAATSQHPGRWMSVPFTGFSDHLVFASMKCPTVSLSHAPDPLNHSAGDTVDSVSVVEIRRAAASAAILGLRLAGPPGPTPSLKEISSWRATELKRTAETAQRYRWYDGGRWSRSLNRYVEYALGEHPSLPGVPGPGGRSWRRAMSGPLNVRGLVATLAEPLRTEVTELLARDRIMLAAMNHMALAVGETSAGTDLAGSASFGLRRPLPQAPTAKLERVLVESGWAAVD